MSTQLQPDSNIPPQVYELAAMRGVGSPLKRRRRKLIQVFLIIILLLAIALLGWLGYNIYGYIAFLIISQTYPSVESVPDNQLDTYLWLQTLHDGFWLFLLQFIGMLLSLFGSAFTFLEAYRAKLYICTDGLLKIYGKKDEAVRWDEVKEFYTINGTIIRLVKQDGSKISLPHLLMGGRDKSFNTFISDEVTRCLLPELLSRYDSGETINFAGLKVNQEGLSLPGDMIFWRQVGDIAQEKDALSVYYREFQDYSKDAGLTPAVFAGKWRTWRKNVFTSASWPNLPVFVALVNTLLDRGANNQWEEVAQQRDAIKELARLAKRRDRRKRRIAIAAISMTLISVLSLAIGIPIYQSVQQQQRVERDTQLLRDYFRQRASKPYTVHVPGEHCGNGKEYWLDDDAKDSYLCQQDGLLITRKALQSSADEWFTFVPDDLSMSDAFSSVNYFPHHYRVQVKATIVSGGPDTCVAVAVHTQDFQGNQSFDLCANGSWAYYRCDLHCNTDKLITSGDLPHASTSYLIAVDVTDSVLSLYVNNAQITSIYDQTYTSTNQLMLSLYGSQSAPEAVSALFSDFSYTPLP